jgi:hypothetical protein
MQNMTTKTTTPDKVIPFPPDAFDIPESSPEINSAKQKEIAALSGYELERILREAANYVEKNKWGFYSSVEEDVKYSLGYLIKTVEVAHEAHKKAMDEHYEKLENTYLEYDKKRGELLRRINGLPQIKFPDIPYVNTDGLQRLLDMAEKLSTLSDNQWGRLLQLAEALKQK